MERIVYTLNKDVCEINVGYNILNTLKDLFKDKKCFIVIDKYIYDNFYERYFKELLEGVEDNRIFVFHSSEDNKDITKSIEIIKRLSDGNFLRDSCLIGIGGGVLLDVVGFISSIYMRGIKLINIPTTLLSQIDSSMGGKNALNMCGYKNLVGTFNHPSSIFIDISFLNTLSKREIISGLAEIIKYGIILESDFLQYIKDNLHNILNLHKSVLEKVIVKSCNFKMQIVKEDECDHNIRKILNFGHTIGHAIESVTNYKVYNHGEAVLIGMFYEMCIAYELKLIDNEYFEFLKSIFREFRFDIDNSIFQSERFYEALIRDKKNKLDKISFILPVCRSKVLEYKFSLKEVREINYSKYRF